MVKSQHSRTGSSSFGKVSRALQVFHWFLDSGRGSESGGKSFESNFFFWDAIEHLVLVFFRSASPSSDFWTTMVPQSGGFCHLSAINTIILIIIFLRLHILLFCFRDCSAPCGQYFPPPGTPTGHHYWQRATDDMLGIVILFYPGTQVSLISGFHP